VVRAARWHAGDPGSIPGSGGLYIFGCIPKRLESASAEILRYKNRHLFISFFFFRKKIGSVFLKNLLFGDNLNTSCRNRNEKFA
jgi:hypothetical protein